MTFPSWIGRVPSNLGSASHGTLSHDALRTLTTVVLPSCLTRLWGLKPPESRERSMLKNFLDMSSAIITALLRASSVSDADEVHRLWLDYLKGTKILYPYLGLVPSQHITLHLSTNIKNFGPAPGQRSNVCERINYLLQKTPTNSKPGQYCSSNTHYSADYVVGEMEKTMLKRFCVAQNIRILLQRLPKRLQAVSEAFTKAFDSDGRGTLQEEIGSYQNSRATYDNINNETILSKELYQLLRDKRENEIPFRRALMQTHISYKRKSFATFAHAPSDSYIIYTDSNGACRAGRITDIIVQKNYGTEKSKHTTTLVVDRFPTLGTTDAVMDPYLAQKRDVGFVGCLCYSDPLPLKDLIELDDIICHTMCHPNDFPGVSREAAHFLPLLRVSAFT